MGENCTSWDFWIWYIGGCSLCNPWHQDKKRTDNAFWFCVWDHHHWNPCIGLAMDRSVWVPINLHCYGSHYYMYYWYSCIVYVHSCSSQPRILMGIVANNPDRMIKIILVGYMENCDPAWLPSPSASVSQDQYQLPMGPKKKKIVLIAEFKEAKVLCKTISPFNSPICLVHKPSSTWNSFLTIGNLVP